MKKQLKSSGNGYVLGFSKSLLKILGYDVTTVKVLLTVNNDTLYIEPITPDDIEKYASNMVRKFQKNGGGYGLYFPNAIIEILEINPDDDFLDIKINDNKLAIKKFI